MKIPSPEPVLGSLPEALEEEARMLRKHLSDLQNEYSKLAQPYVERLTNIESLRPIRYIFPVVN